MKTRTSGQLHSYGPKRVLTALDRRRREIVAAMIATLVESGRAVDRFALDHIAATLRVILEQEYPDA